MSGPTPAQEDYFRTLESMNPSPDLRRAIDAAKDDLARDNRYSTGGWIKHPEPWWACHAPGCEMIGSEAGSRYCGTHLDPEVLARALYAARPALTPFSRQSIPYERARASGINSWARAHSTAMREVGRSDARQG